MVSLKKVQTITHSNDSKSLRVWCAIWNYDGTHLVTCGEDKCIRIWEFDKNSIKEKPILYQSIENEQNRAIRCLAFNYNYDNPRLAAASFDGSVNIYKGNRVEKYIETNKLEGHENEVKCCAYSPNGDYLATCSRDRSTWVWESVGHDNDEDDYEVSSILQSHTNDVKCVAWHSSSEYFVSASYDCSIKMYEFDRPDWVTIQTIENAHESTVWSVSFSHDGKYLASVGSDSNIKIYEFIPRTETESAKLMLIITYDIENCKWPLYSVSWNCQANFFAVGSGDKKIRIFELKEREKLINLETTVECDDEVNNVSWSRNEPKLLVAALDNGQAAVYKLH